MKVSLYAHVNTRDNDPNPETPLLALRRHAEDQGWEIYREYIVTRYRPSISEVV